MFECQYFLGEGLGGIAGSDGAFFLEDGGAVVIFFIDEVDGDTAFGVAGGNNCFMNEVAVHAFTPIFGKQGGVDVNDLVGESLYEVGGYFPEEACEYDQIDVKVLHQFNISVSPEEGFFIYYIRRYIFTGGDLEDSCVRFIGNDGGNPDAGRSFKVIDDFPGI